MNSSHIRPSQPASPDIEKKALRKYLRAQRQRLSPLEQKRATKKLLQQITHSKLLLKHKHIALYLGNDGELDPSSICVRLWQYKKKLYLPVLDPIKQNRMCFCEYSRETILQKNRFNIPEPDFKRSRRLDKKLLSIVLMPLVAFDQQGNRMGMGGGFYDRCFAYKLHNIRNKPKLIGIAHDFQKQSFLPTEPWDVEMECVITDTSIYYFKRTQK